MFNRPLTTRDARRQYLKTQRGIQSTPPALRRERERQEKERIAQEREAEKGRRRAKYLREQKKAREEKARLEKKKMGLPTAPKRPSQGLIMGFVTKALGEGPREEEPVLAELEMERKLEDIIEAEAEAHKSPSKEDLLETDAGQRISGAKNPTPAEETTPSRPPDPSPRPPSPTLPPPPLTNEALLELWSLLPTTSQQYRELQSSPIEKREPVKSQIQSPCPKNEIAKTNDFEIPFIATQDLELTSDDVLEIEGLGGPLDDGGCLKPPSTAGGPGPASQGCDFNLGCDDIDSINWEALITT